MTTYPTCEECGARIVVIEDAIRKYRLRVRKDGTVEVGGSLGTEGQGLRWQPYCEASCGAQYEYGDFGDEVAIGFGASAGGGS